MPDARALVADSGPLIALGSLDQLHLLEHLYPAVLVPGAVVREVVEAGSGRPGSREVQAAVWLERIEVDPPPDPYLLRELGPGDDEVEVGLVRARGAR